MSKFKFELKQEVELVASGETGTIVGRAEYVDNTPGYQVHYKSAGGRAVTVWWNGRYLKAIKQPTKKPAVKRRVVRK